MINDTQSHFGGKELSVGKACDEKKDVQPWRERRLVAGFPKACLPRPSESETLVPRRTHKLESSHQEMCQGSLRENLLV